MTHEELHDFMTANGFTLKGPHFTCYHNPSRPDLRYKVKRLVIRKERQGTWGGWVNVNSNYISALEVSPEGKLRVKKTTEQNKTLASEFLTKMGVSQ